MTFLVVLGIYFAILFLVAYFSHRLVAMASLALCAGAVLAKLWTNDLTPLVAQAGVHVVSPPLGKYCCSFPYFIAGPFGASEESAGWA